MRFATRIIVATVIAGWGLGLGGCACRSRPWFCGPGMHQHQADPFVSVCPPGCQHGHHGATTAPSLQTVPGYVVPGQPVQAMPAQTFPAQAFPVQAAPIQAQPGFVPATSPPVNAFPRPLGMTRPGAAPAVAFELLDDGPAAPIADGPFVVRGQSPNDPLGGVSRLPTIDNTPTPGSDSSFRGPMRASGEPVRTAQVPFNGPPLPGTVPQPNVPPNYAPPPNYAAPNYGAPQPGFAPGATVQPNYGPGVVPNGGPYIAQPGQPGVAPLPAPANGQPGWRPFVPGGEQVPLPLTADPPVADPGLGGNLGTAVPLDVYVDETRTGRLMFGAGINSDAGVTGQVVVDERNFDLFKLPTSWDDFVNGTAFRGRGQGFRFEAMPGSRVQRYLMSLSEPYLLDSQISGNISGYYFDRRYIDWLEQRYGGRIGLGYRLTHDLSIATSFRGENVGILNPRVLGVDQLDRVLGKSDLFTVRTTLTHDTRDIPFAPTEGHYIELSYEQAFGDFDYPRVDAELRKYFLLMEHPDGTQRHTLSFSYKLGVTGSQTPIFENYFAGGYSTIRGFSFRGASPVESTVIVGGRFLFLGSVEYMFPITADDVVKGVAFCDFGTVEDKVQIKAENYRVAPGFGLRISIPALGPAPLALDFAFPVAQAATDDEQIFSFFMGFGRN